MPPNWLIAPKEAVLSWKFLTCFSCFFNQGRLTPQRRRHAYLVAESCLGLWSFQGFNPWSNPTTGSKVMRDSLKCCVTRGWTEIIFLLLWLQINCDNSSSTRTFWTIQDGNFIYNVCSTSTALQICQKVNSWSSDSTDSLISSNSLLYTVWCVALWQLIMRLLPLAIHFW